MPRLSCCWPATRAPHRGSVPHSRPGASHGVRGLAVAPRAPRAPSPRCLDSLSLAATPASWLEPTCCSLQVPIVFVTSRDLTVSDLG
jgi:hypothetical protein